MERIFLSRCLLATVNPYAIKPGLHCLFDTLLKHEVPSCVVVLVTTLVAIIKDQVSDLTERHIRAVCVTTDLEESVETAVIGIILHAIRKYNNDCARGAITVISAFFSY